MDRDDFQRLIPAEDRKTIVFTYLIISNQDTHMIRRKVKQQHTLSVSQ